MSCEAEMKNRIVVTAGLVVLTCIVAGAVWIGTQKGHWQVVQSHGESVTIPANWHATDKHRGYVERRPNQDDGLWFLSRLSPRQLPAAAKPMPNVGDHVREWLYQKGNQFTYYGLWTGHGTPQAIKIHVPRSQQNLALAVLGSWRPGIHKAST